MMHPPAHYVGIAFKNWMQSHDPTQKKLGDFLELAVLAAMEHTREECARRANEKARELKVPIYDNQLISEAIRALTVPR